MVKRKAYQLLCVLALAGTAGIVGCSVDSADSSEEASIGTVEMALSSSTATSTYRLFNASFVIDGPQSTVLSSSEDPTETVLSATLQTGSYTSRLQPGWVLQRNDAGLWVSLAATLVTAEPAAFQIQDGATTNLVYQFETDGTIITVGTGNLNVSINVTETGDSVCTAFGSGCAANQWCAPEGLVGPETVCLPTGPSPANSPCTQVQDCAANTVCASIDGVNNTCIELCPITSGGQVCPGGGGICEITFSPDFGICL
jgi:hypothetical protein